MKHTKNAGRAHLHVSFNSPVILSFTLICALTLVLNYLTGGVSNALLFSVYRSSLTDPLTYLRLFLHVLGHASLDHFINNIMLLLVVGPLLEEKYGQRNILITIVVTALVTGVLHCLVSSDALLGASGVVFALILLSSFTSIREKTIPLTLILVAVLYIGQQIISVLTVQDNISNLTHIAGGLVGAFIGYRLNYRK